MAARSVKTVYSLGGLGNQLFVWAFARWILETTGCEVVLSSAFLAQSSGKHNSFATQIPHSLDKITYKNSKLKAFITRLAIRCFALSKQDQMRGYSRSTMLKVTRFSEIGNCGSYPFEADTASHQYVGYFQTYRFYSELGIAGHDVLEGIEIPETHVTSDSLAIHLRHGDYREHGDLFGLLPFAYYEKAILHQMRSAPVNVIKVFGLFDSESMGLIEQLRATFDKIAFDLDCVTNPRPAHVELKMLAQFQRQVISNSSYAWWACMLAPVGVKVAPKSWFKGMPDPQNLIPESWDKVAFDW